MSHFKYYPKIIYNNLTATNLIIRNAFIQSAFNDYKRFYKYIIKEGERPDIVAYNVYGDPSLDWVVYLTNNILDPYKDWPLETGQFRSYLEDKYNTGADKLSSTLIVSSIKHYYYKGLTSDSQEEINSYNYTMTYETYQKLGSPAGWVPLSIYDYENEINESKREIRVLREIYVDDFKQQFKDLING